MAPPQDYFVDPDRGTEEVPEYELEDYYRQDSTATSPNPRPAEFPGEGEGLAYATQRSPISRAAQWMSPVPFIKEGIPHMAAGLAGDVLTVAKALSGIPGGQGQQTFDLPSFTGDTVELGKTLLGVGGRDQLAPFRGEGGGFNAAMMLSPAKAGLKAIPRAARTVANVVPEGAIGKLLHRQAPTQSGATVFQPRWHRNKLPEKAAILDQIPVIDSTAPNRVVTYRPTTGQYAPLRHLDDAAYIDALKTQYGHGMENITGGGAYHPLISGNPAKAAGPSGHIQIRNKPVGGQNILGHESVHALQHNKGYNPSVIDNILNRVTATKPPKGPYQRPSRVAHENPAWYAGATSNKFNAPSVRQWLRDWGASKGRKRIYKETPKEISRREALHALGLGG